jgi:hypothetical protein
LRVSWLGQVMVGGMVVIVVGVNCIFEFKVGNLRSFVHVRRGSRRKVPW